ncbi:MAG: glucose dehydrogenase [Chloroflexi bacterium]|nr:MAG: glucose dehydrogenase [Chloroflexota bacterium]
MHVQQGKRSPLGWVAATVVATLVGLTALQPAAFVAARPAQFELQLVEFASGFNSPVKIANAGDDRLFIVEQSGIIHIVKTDGTRLAEPFLDLTDRVATGCERGLLGLAFEPGDPATFYVNYTRKSDIAEQHGDTVIARYRVSSTDANRGDPDSEEIVLVVAQPFCNHNAGDLAFGPDGYLYIPLGDGGSGGDPGNRAQNLNELLGKTLRLDVVGQQTYAIPPGNPFADDGDPETRAEIWSYGWRNPWRFSFDRATGDMYAGDVGQGDWEEINVEPPNTPGRNYGWRLCEGSYVYPPTNPPTTCSTNGLTLPIFDIERADARSITGGYVYRGADYPELVGHYIFADYVTGNFWSLARNTEDTWTAAKHGNLGINSPVTFGEDKDGKLYVASHGGTIYRIQTRLVDTPTPTHTLKPTTPPALTPQSYLPFIQGSE